MLAMNNSVAISITANVPAMITNWTNEASRRIDELRKKRGEEQHPLGIGQRGKRSLPEQRPARPGFRSFAADVDSDRRRSPHLDAEPDEIGAAHPLHDREPHERSLEQRADAEHRKRDDGDESRRASEDRVERLAPAVQRAVRQRKRARWVRAKAKGRWRPAGR